MSVIAGVNVALTLALPDVELLKVAVQFAVLVEPEIGARLHWLFVKDPVAVPEAVKLTMPDGVIGVPKLLVLSVTVAVQVAG